ncbi:MAG: DUF4124 domain-containing protein [Gammaproteobacteria bacterium]
MMKTSGYIAMFAMLCVTSGHANADTEIFRWVDSQGVVHYSDRPETSGAKVVGHSKSTDHAKLREQELRNWETEQQEAKDRETREEVADYDAKKAEEEMRIRQVQCARAREMSEVYSDAHRLYETLPNGERKYLTDAELTEARESAMRSVEESCD